MTVTALCHPQHQEGWPTEFYCTPAGPEATASPPQGVTLARPGPLLDTEIESVFQRETEKQADFVFATRPWHKFKQTCLNAWVPLGLPLHRGDNVQPPTDDRYWVNIGARCKCGQKRKVLKVNLHTEEYCKFRKLVERTEDGEWASESEIMQKCLSTDVASQRHADTKQTSCRSHTRAWRELRQHL